MGLGHLVAAQDPPGPASPPLPARVRPTTAEIKSALGVLARLGLPSTAGKRFVRFNTGRYWSTSEQDLEFVFVSGWLLRETESEVEILTVWLVREELRRDRTLPPQWERLKAEHPNDPLPGELVDVDFEKRAAEFASTKIDPPWLRPDLVVGDDDHGKGRFRHAFEASLAAYWELERGKPDLAARLVEVARRSFGETFEEVSKQERRIVTVPTLPSIDALLTGELLADARSRVSIAANEGLPRAKLVERWRSIATLSTSRSADEASSMAKRYESLLADDAKLAEHTKDELASLSVEARVAYWIHKLRDHSALQLGHAESGPYVLERDGAGDELAMLGWDAVPALLDGMLDDRPTRCLGYSWSHDPDSCARNDYRLWTIGDCCFEVFQEIVGPPLIHPDALRDPETRARALQAACREKWEKLKEKGEQSHLVALVSAGKARASSAHRLVERFPEVALPALREGVVCAESEYTRRTFVECVARLASDNATALLESAAASDSSLLVRIAATDGLLKRGARTNLASVIEAWTKASYEAERASSCDQLIEVLVRSGDPAAIRALGKDLAKRPVDERGAVLQALAGSSGVLLGDDHLSPSKTAGPKDSAQREEWRSAIEDLLAASLDDEEEQFTSFISFSKSSRYPRICDTACHMLWWIWPERYAFRLSAPFEERNAQRWVARNGWRARHGLTPLPARTRDVAAVDPARIDAALDALCSAAEADRPAAAARLEALGAGAITAIETRIATLGGKWPASELTRIAKRLGTVVVDVQLGACSAEPDDTWRGRLEALRGKPLTSGPVVDFEVAAATSRLPAGAHGFRIRADRAREGGLIVTASFPKVVGLPRERPGARERNAAYCSLSLGDGGTASFAHTTDEAIARLRDFEARHIDECLASRARMPFSLSLTLRGD